MKKLIILLLCIFIFATSFSYATPLMRVGEKQELLKIDKKYDICSGIIIIGFASYFLYNGLQMTQKSGTYNDGNLLIFSTFPLFFWGIMLIF